MKNRKAIIGIIVILGIGGLWYMNSKNPSEVEKKMVQEFKNVTTYDSEKILSESFALAKDDKIVMKNGSKIVFENDAVISGGMECEDGALTIVAKGNLVIENLLKCFRPEDSADSGLGINIVAEKSLTFSKDAVLISNGHVQIVDKIENLASSNDAINKIFEDVKNKTGEGIRIGPLSDEGETSYFMPSLSGNSPLPLLLRLTGRAAVAAGAEPAKDISGNPVGNTVRLGGTWVVGAGGIPPANITIPTPPKNINKIILYFNFGPGAQVQLQDLAITGPNGRPGKDGEKSCDSRGQKGEDAFRFLASASNITINNFDLHLGSGGNGGNAETEKNCEHGKATGGDGGKAGNFKMVASENFNITGIFNISPGKGGKGGDATAYGKQGKDGCAGENGGKATSRGGNGGANKKKLEITGTVNGVSNIIVKDVEGGRGGDAKSFGGNGGNGTGCKCDGGQGGNATATAGKGGDASSSDSSSTGGNGGNASVEPGAGGKGGTCDPKGPGGNGGNGGDAASAAGKGGKGAPVTGTEGTDAPKAGGNGGNGGDGCGQGSGGKGGQGVPPGKDGEPGKNLCILPPTPTPVTDGGTSPTPTPAPTETPVCPSDSFFDVFEQICVPKKSNDGKTLKAIKYLTTYIPLTEIRVAEKDACDAQHYHANAGAATGIDGKKYSDPQPCGYGKVPQTPVVDIPATPQNEADASLSQTNISFTHTIGASPCPQGVGNVQISGTGNAKTWRVTNAFPSWLQGSATGALPGAVNLSFTCELEQYVTQTLNTTLNFELLDASEKPTGATAALKVTGQVNAR